MALAFDAASSTAVTASPSDPIVLSHTCSAGAERLLAVMIQWVDATGDPLSTAGVTYNGVAMTHLGAADSTLITGVGLSFKHEIWYLVAPATGANDVSVDIVVGNLFGIVVGAASFTGADQTTPLGTAATAGDDGNTGATDPSLTISSAVGEIAIAGVSTGLFNLTALTSNDTEMWNQVDATAITNAGYGGGGQRIAGAASVTIDWTPTPSPQDWAASGVSVKPTAPPQAPLTSDGTSTVVMSADAIASSGMSSAGDSTVVMSAASTAASLVTSDGASTPQLGGVAGMPAAMDLGGTATVTFDGASAAEAPITADGVGALFVGTDASAPVFVEAAVSADAQGELAMVAAAGAEAALTSDGAGDFLAEVEDASAVTDNPVLRWGDSPFARGKRRRREFEEQEDEEILLFVRQVTPLLYQRVKQ